MLAAAGTILVATIYPFLLKLFTGLDVSIGPSYFNIAVIPLLLSGSLAMAISPLRPWNATDAEIVSLKTIGVAIGAAILTGFAAAHAVGGGGGVAGTFAIVGVLVFALVLIASKNVKKRNGQIKTAPFARKVNLLFGHGGVLLAIVGMCGAGFFSQEKIISVSDGDLINIAGLTLRFDGVERSEGDNFWIDRGTLTQVSAENSISKFTISPERRFYPVAGITTSEAAIRKTLIADLYVTLGDLRAPGDVEP